MKKVFTMCFGLLAALAVQAQSDFPLQFADKDGNIIADGTTLNLTETEEDAFGSVQMPSGLYVKNISTADVQGGGSYTIQTLSSGAFQTCFPKNCVRKTTTCTEDTDNDVFAAGSLTDMQTEWFPDAEGSCVVVYQLKTYKKNPITKQWSVDKEGPSVTLNFTYSTTGVAAAKTDTKANAVTYYDLSGRQVTTPAHGIYVRKAVNADGTESVRKVIIR